MQSNGELFQCCPQSYRHNLGRALVSSIYLRFINILKCPPIKAGIVTTLNDYLWSSYLPNALGVGDELTTSHNLYLSLGNDVESRCVKYQALFDGLDLIK
jgi:hypothetical protein